jgi:hypothetical protein
MSRCEYVTIGYYPKTFNDEHVNVAFALHDPEAGKMYFEKIKNIRRVISFDDELSETDFASLLASVERFFLAPFEASLLRQQNDEFVHDPHFFEKNQHVFLNQFRFSPILYCEGEKPEEVFRLLSKVALYYDRDKKNRASSSDVAKAIRLQIENAFAGASQSFVRQPTGNEFTHGESVRFDYRYGNCFVKVFNSLGQDKKSIIDQAKIWFYNANYFKGKDYKLLLVVPDEEREEDQDFSKLVFQGIFQGLNAEVVHSSEFAHRFSSPRS